MQVRAIVTAACQLRQEGIEINPEIMIPIVSHVNELKWLRPRLRAVAKETREKLGVEMTYKFGTMIEVPRAALTAGEIAENTEFFSFGSNDLTQMTFGYSRDDAETKFLNHYVETEMGANSIASTTARSTRRKFCLVSMCFMIMNCNLLSHLSV